MDDIFSDEVLNAYFINAGEINFTPYNTHEPPEYGQLVDIVVAKSREQARYLLWKENQYYLGGLTETTMKTKLIAWDVPGPKRCVKENFKDQLYILWHTRLCY